MTAKIVLFINGLPLHGEFKETIKNVYDIINKYDDTIMPSFNSFNIIRNKVSAFKDHDEREKEFNNIFTNLNDYDEYNLFDIELFHKYIDEFNEPDNTLAPERVYHPQWLLNHLAIKKFLESSTIDHKDFIYIRIRPDRLKYLESLIDFAITNYSEILKTNTYYYNGEAKCGFNQLFSKIPKFVNMKEGLDEDETNELNLILKENEYVMSDQQHICNYYVMLKFMNFSMNINKIHSHETYKRMKYFCHKVNYHLVVNNETKLAYYLISENISLKFI